MAETSTAQTVSPERSTVSPDQGAVSPDRTLSPEQPQQHHAPRLENAPQQHAPPQNALPRNEPTSYPYQPPAQPRAAYRMEIPRPPAKKGWQISNDVFHVIIMITSAMGTGFAFSLLNYNNNVPRNYYNEGEIAIWGLIAGPIVRHSVYFARLPPLMF